jgi:hypothetical protein
MALSAFAQETTHLAVADAVGDRDVGDLDLEEVRHGRVDERLGVS